VIFSSHPAMFLAWFWIRIHCAFKIFSIYIPHIIYAALDNGSVDDSGPESASGNCGLEISTRWKGRPNWRRHEDEYVPLLCICYYRL